ncbi:glycoside hydrolase family 13 protein [Candidatus Neomarinimicrobiota bacterium]
MTRILSIMVISIFILNSCGTSVRQSNSPDWAADAVWYQIFPERFRNGDPTNDPTSALDTPVPIPGWQVHPWGSDFYKRQAWEVNVRADNFYWMHTYRRYGGDIQGIIDKLDYLADLGITAIYLNPIFNADSHHKYDGSTYHHIDYYFGPDPRGDSLKVAAANETDDPATWIWTKSDLLFIELLSQAHARGMKIVTDGVFNHIGRSHFAFKDVLRNQQNSVYAHWFEIENWDDPATEGNEFEYNGWYGIQTLPEINEEDGTVVDGPRQYIFNSVKRWMDPNGDGDPIDGIDGWRLDVVNDMGDRWWKEWHAHIRSINPNIFTTAEIWDVNAKLLGNEYFSSSMNYPFAMAVLRFVGDKEWKIKPTELVNEFEVIRNAYGLEISLGLQNLIDSHDTDRLPTILMNPDRNYDRYARPDQVDAPYSIQRPGEDIIRLQKLIVLMQMTYVGAPMIYYGDEAGMWGEDDPGCRKPMIWSDIDYETEIEHPLGLEREPDPVAVNQELFEYYRSAIKLRRDNPELARGNIETILLDDKQEIWVFKRITDSGSITVVINNSDSASRLELPTLAAEKLIFSLGAATPVEGGKWLLDPRSGFVYKN